jgi:hypothetical protein
LKALNTGFPNQSPYMAVLNRLTEIVRKLASELALPHAQRNRIGLNDTGAGDCTPSPWDEFIMARDAAYSRSPT